MNRQEIEHLAERIGAEAAEYVDMLDIEHVGPASKPQYATDFFVKCMHKKSGLLFAVKSFDHWEDIKQDVLGRLSWR